MRTFYKSRVLFNYIEFILMILMTKRKLKTLNQYYTLYLFADKCPVTIVEEGIHNNNRYTCIELSEI